MKLPHLMCENERRNGMETARIMSLQVLVTLRRRAFENVQGSSCWEKRDWMFSHALSSHRFLHLVCSTPKSRL